jgi:hypothetical protein
MNQRLMAARWSCGAGRVTLAIALCLIIAVVNCRCTAASGVSQPQPGLGIYFVATNGNDAWSGKSPSPNSSKTDGPFATAQGAVNRLRASQRKGGGTNTIFFRRGTYFLKEPLVLRPGDSYLAFVSYGAEQPMFSGGKRVKGWREVELNGKKLWAASAVGENGKNWIFRELWTNGKRATRARHPNQGYLSIAELVDPSSDWTKGQSRFRFKARDVKAWPSAENAEVVAMSRWVESRLPIASIDESNSTINFSKRSVFELAVGDPYYVEGALELLDSPGEWYLDPKAGMVYYQPRPGEKINAFEAIAPALSQLVRIEGNSEKDEFVQRLVFRGLTFAHAEWYFPDGFAKGTAKPVVSPPPQPEVGGFAQAAIGVPGAFWAQGLREGLIEDCTFEHIGDYALELGRGCQSNVVRRCEIGDLGAGGIRLGETAIRERAGEQARGNEISDCQIHDGGKMFHSAIGVWIGQSPDNRLIRNLIHDFYYTGISIGWTWGYGPALATNNLVLDNHIHHIGIKSDGDGPILSDMGGIYTLGKQPGTRIVNNLWHDIAGIHYGGWGIYFDEGSSGILAQSNLVYRTTHGGFHQHYGETNIVRNNIFAFGRDQQLQRSRVETHPSFEFRTNIVYFDAGNLMSGDWSGDQYQIDYNIYFDARPASKTNSLMFGPATLEKWRERGHDLHSLIANPLFAAPARNDFHLSPASPALKLGFQPLDLGRVGPANATRQ